MARLETIRVFLSLAAQMKWQVYHLDVKSVFLNGEIQAEVYFLQPDGFIIQGSEEKVYKLKKALYGLRQAPRVMRTSHPWLLHHLYHLRMVIFHLTCKRKHIKDQLHEVMLNKSKTR